MTPELLKRAGQALYGHYWRAPVAETFNVSKRQVDSWADRRCAMPSDTAERLAILVLERERGLRRVFHELDRERRKP